MTASSEIFKAKLLRKVRRLKLSSTISTYSDPHTLISAISAIENIEELQRRGIGVGNTVLLRIIDTDENMLVNLVSDNGAKTDRNSISVYSPLGNALLGKERNDVFSVSIFRSRVDFKVLYVGS